MKIEVRLYAGLGAYAPGGETGSTLEVEDGTGLALVLARLGIPDRVDKVILVNGRPAGKATVLADGDTIVMFRPAEGG